LVRGAAGSVVACATQMAKEAGASVYGTARARDVERVRALGAEPIVEDDRVGAQLASRSLDAASTPSAATHSKAPARRCGLTGSSSPSCARRTRPMCGRKACARRISLPTSRDRLDRILAVVERGTLNLPVGEVLDLADASAAHRMLDGAPHKPGKIVLKVAD
jgi:NADPH:quinone reductase-like Zn-dependent oxidoreductase